MLNGEAESLATAVAAGQEVEVNARRSSEIDGGGSLYTESI
jgi:hypothetical protein